MGETKPTWRVRMSTDDEPTAPLIVHVLACQEVFRALTKPQRAVLIGAEGGRCTGHPRPLRALQDHGLVDEDHRLTEVGAEVRLWNLPSGHPDRVAHAEQVRRSTTK